MDQSTATPSMKEQGPRSRSSYRAWRCCVSSGCWHCLGYSIVRRLCWRCFRDRTAHGLSVSVEAWHVRIFPSIGLELLQVQAHDPGSATPLFVADRLKIALQWLPLLEGRVVGKDVVIDRPRLTVRRSADGSWSLAAELAPLPPDDSAPPVAFLQAVRNLLVVDGSDYHHR